MVKKPKLGRDYKVIENVLLEEDFVAISKISKLLPLMNEPKILNEKILANVSVVMDLTENHHWKNEGAVWRELEGLDPLLRRIFSQALNRMAKELKLAGQQGIVAGFNRYLPNPGRGLDQGWHFDQGAQHTMVMVLHNDFDYLEGKGLDMAFNQVEGPFAPEKFSTNEQAIPVEGSIESEA